MCCFPPSGSHLRESCVRIISSLKDQSWQAFAHQSGCTTWKHLYWAPTNDPHSLAPLRWRWPLRFCLSLFLSDSPCIHIGNIHMTLLGHEKFPLAFMSQWADHGYSSPAFSYFDTVWKATKKMRHGSFLPSCLTNSSGIFLTLQVSPRVQILCSCVCSHNVLFSSFPSLKGKILFLFYSIAPKFWAQCLFPLKV